uniref:CMP/dCMP-type deaminase domain-containing protein n=1 Tax=Hyaloperonospora arabidopsidis (strain Emoy2) TaxID=559515 RepID=M4C3Q9_HYAAE
MELVEVVASSDEELEDVEAQQRFVALEVPAHFGSKVMQHLSRTFRPLSELGFAHLKRLKKHPKALKTLVALVCPSDSTLGDDFDRASAHDEVQQLETLFQGRLTTAEVLKRAPRSRALFEKHSKNWPLIFHASVDKVAASPPIEKEEKRNMLAHLRVAVEAGKRLQAKRHKALTCAWGCVVVDPFLDEHVATSNVSDEMPKCKIEALCHPMMVAINVVAERDRRRGDAAKDEMAHQKKQRKGQERDKAARCQEDMDDMKHSGSYLCTGYDVYLDCEPCAMCAMALVHSRARRVIFDRDNPGDGVLVSSFKLHTIASLNHHYRVFQLKATSES